MTYNLSGLPTGSLQPGMTGSSVQQLQQWLVSNGFMSQADMNTGPGIYGPKTTAAVLSLQKQLGVDYTSGPGYFGPKTLGALQTQTAAPAPANTLNFSAPNMSVANSTPAYVAPKPAAAPAQQPAAQPAAAAPAPAQNYTPQNFSGAQPPSSNLQPGMSGSGVQQLQQWLLGQGYAIPSLQNGSAQFGYYGDETKAALTQWQKDNGVAAGSNFGYYGPLTMAKVGISAPAAAAGAPAPGTGGQPAAPGANYIPGTQIETTGNTNLDSILTGLSKFVDNTLAKGNVVNPALQITPDLVAKFLDEAHQQVDPYFQNLIKQELGGINASLKTLGAQYTAQTGQQQQNFQQDVADEREAASGNGIAFSGERGLNEQNMLTAQNRTLGSIDTNYAQSVGDVLRKGAGEIGSNTLGLPGSLSDFQLPNLTGSRATLEGARGGSVAGPALDLNYNPANYSYGSLVSGSGGYSDSLTKSSNAFLGNYLAAAGNNGAARTFQTVNGVPTLT